MALMRIDQNGVLGTPGVARRDGTDDGAEVTLTDMTAGGTTLFEILWCVPEDVGSLASLAATGASHVWTFTPTVGVNIGQPIRIRLTHTTLDGVVTTQIRILGFPDGNDIVAPAPGELSDPRATRANATDPSIIDKCERNWPTDDFPDGNPFGWGLDLAALIAISSAAAGPATELATTGAPVNIGDAAPPETGQIPIADDAEHASWRDPIWVPLSLFGVNDVVVGIAGDGGPQPAALNMPASTILARLASGDVVAATVSQINTLLGGGIDSTARAAAAAAQATANAAVPAALFDANTILAATSDNTPVALTVGASTLVGRKATGGIVAATAAEIAAIVSGQALNDSAAVPKTLYDANTVLVANADDTPIALTMGPLTILMRGASGNIKAATPAELQVVLNTTGSRALKDLPASAGALDDEFESTTINPAWVFRDTTTGPTNRTPNFGPLTENTDIVGATTVPNVALHTQGRASWMLVQPTTTGPAVYQIYKPFTWVSGQFYWARLVATHGRGATVNSGGLFLWASSGGVPDNNNRGMIFYDWVNGTVRWGIVVGGVTTNVTNAINEGRGLNPYFGIANPAGVLGGSASWYGEIFTEDGYRQIPAGIGAASFSFTPAFIGFTAVSSPGKPNVTAIDFVREHPGHPLFH